MKEKHYQLLLIGIIALLGIIALMVTLIVLKTSTHNATGQSANLPNCALLEEGCTKSHENCVAEKGYLHCDIAKNDICIAARACKNT